MKYLSVIIGAFLIAVYFVYVSGNLKSKSFAKNHSNLVIAVSYIIASLCLLPIWIIGVKKGGIFLSLNMVFFIYILITVCLMLLAKELQFYAFSKIDLARVSPFSALTPLVAIGSGWLVYRHLPNLSSTLGIVIICVSIYLLHCKKVRLISLKELARPFYNIFSNRYVFCAFLSALPPAVCIAFQKKSVAMAGVINFSFFFTLGIGLAALSAEFIMYKKSLVLKKLKSIPIEFALISGLLLAFSQLALSLSTKYYLVPQVSALLRLSIVFQIILAFIFLKEKEDILKRIMVSIAIVIGFFIINLS